MLSKALQIASANAGGESLYVDDVFSTYLWTGNGSTQTITNGIDLAGEGGLTWFKSRMFGAQSHVLIDSARGTNKALFSNETREQITESWSVTYNSDGMTLPAIAADPINGIVNFNGYVMASWTFRKAPKFFDVVTYTGDGTAGKTVAHNLGAIPGFIIYKRTGPIGENWFVQHRSLSGGIGGSSVLILDQTSAVGTSTGMPVVTDSTITFQGGALNNTGATYVAYLFAHDAGGFGDSGDENVISCGSFTKTDTGFSNFIEVNLGWEVQWLLTKKTNESGAWELYDVQRGMDLTKNKILQANSANAETSSDSLVYPTATGFAFRDNNDSTNIYIAIRRPMKTPESGTEVFSAVTYTGTSATRSITTNILTDLAIYSQRDKVNELLTTFASRLASPTVGMSSTGTDAEYSISGDEFFGITSNQIGISDYNNRTGRPYINWNFRRASGFFDVVCYTGDGVAGRTVAHNLTVTPEMMIIKSRTDTRAWAIYHSAIGNESLVRFDSEPAPTNSIVYWNNTSPNSSVFTCGTNSTINGSARNYVAYLFATLAGVSKVGSYTGNGSSQTIDCGFAGGARFFLVKATSTTGSWWVYDSARGIVSGNDPALQLNSTAAEVTSADAVDPDSSGIIVNQEATCSINASGVTYIFLAIA